MPKFKVGDKVVIVSQNGPWIMHYYDIGEVCRILAIVTDYYELESSINQKRQSVEECCFKLLKPVQLENK